MTGGNDPISGYPVVYNGAYSIRLGNAYGEGGGETLSFSFTVTNANVNFTYAYSVLIDGSHSQSEQPYFRIRMRDGSGSVIPCATYDVDGSTAPSIGGFVPAGGALVKPWTPVFIPLSNYIGQTVTMTFETADCSPNGFAGSHWTYAYIDASCAPIEIISSQPTVCGGAEVFLTAPDGAGTYSWTGPGIIPPTGNQQIVTIDQPGLYTVTMTTLGNTPCTMSLDTVMAGSPNNPVSDFIYTPVCEGETTVFTNQSTPAANIIAYDWDFDNDGVSDDQNIDPTNLFPTAGTYPVTLSISWPPCVVDTTIDVIVAPVPTSPFTVDNPVCTGETSTITYTGNAPTIATYNWDFDGGTVVSGSGQGPYEISWTSAGTKTISLDVSIGSCASPLTTVSVTVNAGPLITLPPPPTVCSGEPTSITVSGATTYAWSPATGLNTTTGATVIASPTSNITYTISGTSNGCTTDTTLDVNTEPFPSVTVSPTAATICAGETVSFTANGGTTYLWEPALGLSATTGTTVDASPAVTSNYSVIGTTNGCADTADFVITVNPSPTVIVSPDVSICAGETTTLTANGAATFTWTPSAGLNTTTGASVDASPTDTTTYTVTGDDGNGCTRSEDVTVNIIPYPNLSILPNAATICDGEVQTFTASGGPNYTWSPPLGLNTTTGATVDADPSVSTTYQVVSINLGCNDTATVDLTVNPIPVITVSADTTICSGSTAPLSVQGGTTYSWTPATGLSATSGPNVNASPIDTVTYTITGTSLGCSSNAVVTVNVNQTPTVSIDPVTTAFCDGNSDTLTASGADIYLWSPAIGLSDTLGSVVIADPTTSTNYAVVGVTNEGCFSNAASLVTVYPNPVPNFIADTAGCEVFCTNFTNQTIITSGAIASYSWDFGDGTIVNGENPGHCYQDMGLFSVTLMATSDNQCITTLTETDYITVYPLPDALFTVNPQVANIIDSKFTFTDLSSLAAEWNWSFGNGGTSTIQNPIYVYQNPTSGTYPITLMVTTEFGCLDTISGEITIKPNASIYVPNAITPNNNGRNEIFYAYGEGIVEFEMTIFDRWGEQLFFSADMEDGWDGTYLGKPVEMSVYVYRIDYVDVNGDSDRLVGRVSVVR